MIKLVNFLILSKKLTKYNKKDIDQGKTPPDIYTLCSCIREIFCLSYALRKNNNLYLYFFENHLGIKLVGRKLRYLGSDERSQALLLNKAIRKFEEKKDKHWVQSTPGIYVNYFLSNKLMLEQIIPFQLNPEIWIFDLEQRVSQIREMGPQNIPFNSTEDNLYILIPRFDIRKENPHFIELLNIKNNSQVSSLNIPNLNKPQDRLLYVNFCLDSVEMSDQ